MKGLDDINLLHPSVTFNHESEDNATLNAGLSRCLRIVDVQIERAHSALDFGQLLGKFQDCTRIETSNGVEWSDLPRHDSVPYINAPDEQWIGKGSIKWVEKRGESGWCSAEETTNLPFEMQAALDDVSRRGPKARQDHRILELVARSAPLDRVWPYQDFEAPREAAMRKRTNRINDQKPIAWFNDDDDPQSLEFESGYEPDFRRVIDMSKSRSTMYEGPIDKIRIASRNKEIQYLFVRGKQHVWIVHPQPFTTELSSFGVRTVDVEADEELFIPASEFYTDADDDGLHVQIPPGFAGPICSMDPDRADASPWNDKLPIIRRFRRSKI